LNQKREIDRVPARSSKGLINRDSERLANVGNYLANGDSVEERDLVTIQLSGEIPEYLDPWPEGRCTAVQQRPHRTAVLLSRRLQQSLLPAGFTDTVRAIRTICSLG
jgi:hypothetical protein